MRLFDVKKHKQRLAAQFAQQKAATIGGGLFPTLLPPDVKETPPSLSSQIAASGTKRSRSMSDVLKKVAAPKDPTFGGLPEGHTARRKGQKGTLEHAMSVADRIYGNDPNYTTAARNKLKYSLQRVERESNDSARHNAARRASEEGEQRFDFAGERLQIPREDMAEQNPFLLLNPKAWATALTGRNKEAAELSPNRTPEVQPGISDYDLFNTARATEQQVGLAPNALVDKAASDSWNDLAAAIESTKGAPVAPMNRPHPLVGGTIGLSEKASAGLPDLVGAVNAFSGRALDDQSTGNSALDAALGLVEGWLSIGVPAYQITGLLSLPALGAGLSDAAQGENPLEAAAEVLTGGNYARAAGQTIGGSASVARGIAKFKANRKKAGAIAPPVVDRVESVVNGTLAEPVVEPVLSDNGQQKTLQVQEPVAPVSDQPEIVAVSPNKKKQAASPKVEPTTKETAASKPPSEKPRGAVRIKRSVDIDGEKVVLEREALAAYEAAVAAHEAALKDTPAQKGQATKAFNKAKKEAFSKRSGTTRHEYELALAGALLGGTALGTVSALSAPQDKKQEALASGFAAGAFSLGAAAVSGIAHVNKKKVATHQRHMRTAVDFLSDYTSSEADGSVITRTEDVARAVVHALGDRVPENLSEKTALAWAKATIKSGAKDKKITAVVAPHIIPVLQKLGAKTEEELAMITKHVKERKTSPAMVARSMESLGKSMEQLGYKDADIVHAMAVAEPIISRDASAFFEVVNKIDPSGKLMSSLSEMFGSKLETVLSSKKYKDRKFTRDDMLKALVGDGVKNTEIYYSAARQRLMQMGDDDRITGSELLGYVRTVGTRLSEQITGVNPLAPEVKQAVVKVGDLDVMTRAARERRAAEGITLDSINGLNVSDLSPSTQSLVEAGFFDIEYRTERQSGRTERILVGDEEHRTLVRDSLEQYVANEISFDRLVSSVLSDMNIWGNFSRGEVASALLAELIQGLDYYSGDSPTYPSYRDVLDEVARSDEWAPALIDAAENLLADVASNARPHSHILPELLLAMNAAGSNPGASSQLTSRLNRLGLSLVGLRDRLVAAAQSDRNEWNNASWAPLRDPEDVDADTHYRSFARARTGDDAAEIYVDASHIGSHNYAEHGPGQMNDSPGIRIGHLLLSVSPDRKTVHITETQSDYAQRGVGPKPMSDPKGVLTPYDAPVGRDWHKIGIKYALAYAVQLGADTLEWSSGSDISGKYGKTMIDPELIRSGAKEVRRLYDQAVNDYAKEIGATYDSVVSKYPHTPFQDISKKIAEGAVAEVSEDALAALAIIRKRVYGSYFRVPDGMQGDHILKTMNRAINDPISFLKTHQRLYDYDMVNEISMYDKKYGGDGIEGGSPKPFEPSTDGNINAEQHPTSHKWKIPERLKEALKNKEITLYSRHGEVVFGAYNPVTSLIELKRGIANVETVFHELGHHLHRILLDTPESSEVISNIYGDMTSRGGAEQFAEDFTAWLSHSKKTNPKLEPSFQAVAAWIKSKIGDQSAWADTLDPEVAKIFDRIYSGEPSKASSIILAALKSSDSPAARTYALAMQNSERPEILEFAKNVRDQAMTNPMGVRLTGEETKLAETILKTIAEEFPDAQEYLLEALKPDDQGYILSGAAEHIANALVEATHGIRDGELARLDGQRAAWKMIQENQDKRMKDELDLYAQLNDFDATRLAKMWGAEMVKAIDLDDPLYDAQTTLANRALFNVMANSKDLIPDQGTEYYFKLGAKENMWGEETVEATAKKIYDSVIRDFDKDVDTFGGDTNLKKGDALEAASEDMRGLLWDFSMKKASRLRWAAEMGKKLSDIGDDGPGAIAMLLPPAVVAYSLMTDEEEMGFLAAGTISPRGMRSRKIIAGIKKIPKGTKQAIGAGVGAIMLGAMAVNNRETIDSVLSALDPADLKKAFAVVAAAGSFATFSKISKSKNKAEYRKNRSWLAKHFGKNNDGMGGKLIDRVQSVVERLATSIGAGPQAPVGTRIGAMSTREFEAHVMGAHTKWMYDSNERWQPVANALNAALGKAGEAARWAGKIRESIMGPVADIKKRVNEKWKPFGIAFKGSIGDVESMGKGERVVWDTWVKSVKSLWDQRWNSGGGEYLQVGQLGVDDAYLNSGKVKARVRVNIGDEGVADASQLIEGIVVEYGVVDDRGVVVGPLKAKSAAEIEVAGGKTPPRPEHGAVIRDEYGDEWYVGDGELIEVYSKNNPDTFFPETVSVDVLNAIARVSMDATQPKRLKANDFDHQVFNAFVKDFANINKIEYKDARSLVLDELIQNWTIIENGDRWGPDSYTVDDRAPSARKYTMPDWSRVWNFELAGKAYVRGMTRQLAKRDASISDIGETAQTLKEMIGNKPPISNTDLAALQNMVDHAFEESSAGIGAARAFTGTLFSASSVLANTTYLVKMIHSGLGLVQLSQMSNAISMVEGARNPKAVAIAIKDALSPSFKEGVEHSGNIESVSRRNVFVGGAISKFKEMTTVGISATGAPLTDAFARRFAASLYLQAAEGMVKNISIAVNEHGGDFDAAFGKLNGGRMLRFLQSSLKLTSDEIFKIGSTGKIPDTVTMKIITSSVVSQGSTLPIHTAEALANPAVRSLAALKMFSYAQGRVIGHAVKEAMLGNPMPIVTLAAGTMIASEVLDEAKDAANRILEVAMSAAMSVFDKEVRYVGNGAERRKIGIFSGTKFNVKEQVIAIAEASSGKRAEAFKSAFLEAINATKKHGLTQLATDAASVGAYGIYSDFSGQRPVTPMPAQTLWQVGKALVNRDEKSVEALSRNARDWDIRPRRKENDKR